MGHKTRRPEKAQQGPSTTVGVPNLGSKQREFQHKTVQSLRHSTAHSAGLDLATATTATITDGSVNLISTGVYGPLPHNVCGLLIGCASTTKSGHFVLPGVIDSDFNGEIKIKIWTANPPCTIPKGEHIAQLILLPYHAVKTLFQYDFLLPACQLQRKLHNIWLCPWGDRKVPFLKQN